MDIIQKYEKLCNKSIKLNSGSNIDIESAHIHQDKVYRLFIKDIDSNKFKSIDDIKYVAKIIKRDIVKYDKESNRWYS